MAMSKWCSICKMFPRRAVVVCLCCYNKMPQTGCLINNINLFLTIMEAGSLRLGHRHGRVRALFWVADFLLHLHMAEGAQVLSKVFFIRALISFMRAPSSCPNHIPKASLPDTSTLGITISTCEFRTYSYYSKSYINIIFFLSFRLFIYGNWDNNDTTYLRPKIRPSGTQDEAWGLWPNTGKAPSFVWVQHQFCRVWHRVCCRLFQKVIERKRLWVIEATSQMLCIVSRIKINDNT